LNGFFFFLSEAGSEDVYSANSLWEFHWSRQSSQWNSQRVLAAPMKLSERISGIIVLQSRLWFSSLFWSVHEIPVSRKFCFCVVDLHT
jgi:hypothetical protein